MIARPVDLTCPVVIDFMRKRHFRFASGSPILPLGLVTP